MRVLCAQRRFRVAPRGQNPCLRVQNASFGWPGGQEYVFARATHELRVATGAQRNAAKFIHPLRCDYSFYLKNGIKRKGRPLGPVGPRSDRGSTAPPFYSVS